MTKKSNIRFLYGLSFIDVICLIILFLPVEILLNTSIYTVETPNSIGYKYRSFDFSIIQLPIIVLGLLYSKKSKSINFGTIILLIAFKDWVYVSIFGLPQSIPYDLSLFLILLTSWALSVLVFREKKDLQKSTIKFIDAYTLLAFLSQILRLVLGLSTEGRFGALGLSVGGTGFLMSTYIIFSLCVKERIGFITILSFLSLILSGQRTNLFLCVIFCLLYIILTLYTKKFAHLRKKNSKYLFFFFATSFVLILLLSTISVLTGGLSFGLDFLDRTIESLNLFVDGNLQKEGSVEGRFLSVVSGLEVLTQHPFGLSNVFYELQYYMSEMGYPTFPHNFVIANSLLWSPFVILLCFFWQLKLTIKLFVHNSILFIIPFYILVLSFLWGSPFTDYCLLFVILFFLSYSNFSLKSK